MAIAVISSGKAFSIAMMAVPPQQCCTASKFDKRLKGLIDRPAPAVNIGIYGHGR
jgi:hypothetical protein